VPGRLLRPGAIASSAPLVTPLLESPRAVLVRGAWRQRQSSVGETKDLAAASPGETSASLVLACLLTHVISAR